jgi:DNA polymerase III subunit delta'
MDIYPWQTGPWTDLARYRAQLPHAILIRGREGIGAEALGRAFAESLLCESPAEAGHACGRCPGCNWLAQGNHPDFRMLQPESLAPEPAADAEDAPAPARREKKSDQIRIDQVRELQDFLAIGTHRAGLRVVLIHPAEAMNPNTQNALLKSLEEPPPGTVFVLVSGNTERLLPTVRSRCIVLDLPAPERGTALAWLKQQGVAEAEDLLAAAGGAPLAAAGLAEVAKPREGFLAALRDPKSDALDLANAAQGIPPPHLVAWMQRWCYDLLSARLGAPVRYHPKYENLIVETSRRTRASDLAGYLRVLAQARSLAQHPLNPRLFFEDLLIRYRALESKTSGGS